MYEYLDRRYALALYEVAEEKNKVEEYLNDLREICDIIYGNNELYEIIKHPQISTVRKKKTFRNIFEGKIDDELLSFLMVLKEMEKIHLERNNTLLAEVKSVVPLTEDEVTRLVAKLENKYSKKILLKQEIDKSIIGGLYVRVGDDVIDGTVKSRLDDMKQIMLKRE